MKWIVFLALLFSTIVSGSNLEAQSDTVQVKKGWTFGAVPAIAYDSDVGVKYGGLVNFYNFGDGRNYPKYEQSILLELSRTTKGSGINQFLFDSEHLIPKIRTTVEISVLTEKALDFYGFNGYKSYYNKNFEDDEHDEYISRMYYRVDRRLSRIRTDFQGNLIENKLRWLAGFVYYKNKMGPVDIENLNKGKRGTIFYLIQHLCLSNMLIGG